MDFEKERVPDHGESRGEAVDFRHLSAFQTVYQEKSYSCWGKGVVSTRKSVMRMMQNLERSFHCSLFEKGALGELVPSAFAERLFNDLRFLTAARYRMMDHVRGIRESGRVLHVGSSAAVFRTQEFRNLFREIQSIHGIRTSYSPVDAADAGRLLMSGQCDLYIGCWSGTASRFVSREAGCVGFRCYRRRGAEAATGSPPSARTCLVALDGKPPAGETIGRALETPEIITDSKWLYWLDHPEDCPADTRIIGPEVQLDPMCWEVEDLGVAGPVAKALRVSFLRQHPYEFLPALVGKIEKRVHL